MEHAFNLQKAVVRALVCALLIALPASWGDDGPEHQVVQPRPMLLGTSGGNVNDMSRLYCCSGTLGALVQDVSGMQFILSNNHVLAITNAGTLGDDVSQPGLIDQNCQPEGAVADLSDFVPLEFKRKVNTVDAAIAQVRPGAVRTDGAILDIGPVSGNTVQAFVGQPVQKSGRTTGHTTGTVAAIDVVVNVGYSKSCGGPSSLVAQFAGQIRITPGTFSDGGDSGSLIVESGAVDPADGLPRAVGLLFAGSSTSTIANPIGDVLNALGVTMSNGSPPPPPPVGSVAGAITRADDHTPIAEATVSMDTGQSTLTADDGTYLVTDVPVGDRTVTASATGFVTQNQVIAVTEGATATADFALPPVSGGTQALVDCVIYTTAGGKNGNKHLNVAVSTVDDQGWPVANAQVTINLQVDGSTYATGVATTDSSGTANFAMSNAPNGTYETIVNDVTAAGLVFEGSTPPNQFVKGVDSSPASFCRNTGTPASGAGLTAGASTAALAHARAVKNRHGARLSGVVDVAGHGIGCDEDGTPVVEVYLRRENASARASLPRMLETVPVSVFVTGDFKAL